MKFMSILLSLTIFISHIALCEKGTEKNNLVTKFKSKITAVPEEETPHKDFGYYSNKYFRKVFSFSTPINKCVEENCEFCCLSLNFCGSKQQCENSNYTMNILKIMFVSVCILLGCFLVYKIYITDPEPEHQDEDKIEEKTLNFLIGMFIHNRENRRKFKL